MNPDAIGLRLALAGALVLGATAPALAQASPDEPPDTVAVTERMQGHATQHLSRSVSDHVGWLLTGRAPSGAEANLFPEANPSPVASATAGSPQWSAWVGPSATWSDQGDGAAGNEGHTITTYLGVDRRLGGRGVLGILGGPEVSDFDTAQLGGDLDSEGFGVGLYGGYSVTDVIVLDAVALYSWINNDYSDRARSASYDSERLQLAANATAYLAKGQLSIRPKLGVTYARDEQEAYRDSLGTRSPKTETETFSVNAGVQAGYIVFLDERRWIEPYLGVTAVVDDFSSDPDSGSDDELDPFDLRLSAGLSGQLADGLSLSISADVSGLARSDYEEFTLGGQISLQF